jgi:hypothetical protein
MKLFQITFKNSNGTLNQVQIESRSAQFAWFLAQIEYRAQVLVQINTF